MLFLPKILAHSFDAIVCFGDWQEVVVWNPEAARIFGMKESEALGQTVEDLRRCAALTKILALVRQVSEGRGTQQIEQTIQLPGGEGAVLDVVVTRVSDGAHSAPAVAVIARDLTVTRQAQAAIRAAEKRFRFLNDLGKTTRALSAPTEIMAAVTSALGRHLQASRCAYADVEADSDQFTIRHDYVDGCASTAGEYQLALFGPRAVSDMRAGRTLVIRDLDAELSPGEGAEMFNAIDVRAIVCCPLAKDGRLRAMMAIHQTTPRDWTPEEIALVQEVVERCWAIIERAKADAVLRATESLKGAILGTSLDGFILMDHEGKIADWNGAAERIFGATRAEVMGNLLSETIFPPRLRAEHERELAKYMVSRQSDTLGTRFEIPAMRKDGTEFPAEISINQIPGTEPPLFARFVRDISERRRAEEALRAAIAETEAAGRTVAESAERFRLLAEVVSLQVWTAQISGELDYANGQCAAYFGVDLETGVLGNAWSQFVHPDDLPSALRLWQHSLATGEPYEMEFRLRGHAGEYRWFLVRAQPLRDAAGAITKWFGSNTEIHDLKTAQGEAERANRAKDDFLAALSHELRTPLTPVLMTAASLRGDERLPEDAREQLGMMERNIALEARLIDDLLDLTRIARGQMHHRAERCDAHSLIGLAVEIVRDDAMAKGITLDREFLAQHSGLTADPARFQQLVWNLLRNSVKFTPRGGRISIRTHDDDAGRLRIEVADSGVGIEAVELEKIFLPFEQGGGEHRFGGMGLGLAIARAIVELHGGTISAASEGRNQGATFTVELPGATEPPHGVTTASTGPADWIHHDSASDEAAASPRLRLLVVEDHESTLEVLSRLLRHAGHHVVTAGNLADALAAASEGEFDLVISDLGLPDGTGNELMAMLRARYGLRGVALSGYGMEEDIERSRLAGFATHLTKPVDFPQLQRALREMSEGDLK